MSKKWLIHLAIVSAFAAVIATTVAASLSGYWQSNRTSTAGLIE